MRKIQIGVMGSAADLQYSRETEQMAEQVGALVAERNAALVFGAEKDNDSLSTAACRGAKKKQGLTIGITYGVGKKIKEKKVDIVIPSGMERGGGREFLLALACDAMICIGGGSGTLNEIVVAYQQGIPIVVLEKSGGWSEQLVERFLDERKRIKIVGAQSPEEAVETAFKLVGDTREI